MKKGRIFTNVSIIAFLLIISGSVYAQDGQRGQRSQRGQRAQLDQNSNRNQMRMMERGSRIETVLDLNEEQKEKLANLRAEHQKDLRYQKNVLNEKNAKLKTLLSAPDQDMKKINSTIDEISGMKGELMKKQIANKNEMKAILTPEQVQKFESLGLGNGLNRGLGERGNRGKRDFSRGGRGDFGPREGRAFHGRGFGQSR